MTANTHGLFCIEVDVQASNRDSVGFLEGVPYVLITRVRKSLVAPAGAPTVPDDEVGRRVADDRHGVTAASRLSIVGAEQTVRLDVVPAGVHPEAGQDGAVKRDPFLEPIEL